MGGGVLPAISRDPFIHYPTWLLHDRSSPCRYVIDSKLSVSRFGLNLCENVDMGVTDARDRS